MADLHMHPQRLTEFANEADAQIKTLAAQLKTVTFDPIYFGQFDEATELANALNKQLQDVHARLYSSIGILQDLARAATEAAAMTKMSDADVAKTMKRVNASLAAAETSLAQAPQGPAPDPKPAQRGPVRAI